MKKQLSLCLLALTTATTFISCSKDDNPAPIVQADIPSLDSKITTWMNTSGMPGMTIAISKNGKMVYKKAYGQSDQDASTPATNESRFRIASVSKILTAAAVLKLVQAGSLAMDQKVFGTGALLGTTYGTQPYSANVSAITLSHLLHHTSGGWGNTSNDPAFFTVTMTTDEVINYTLNNIPLANAPGTTFAYSNFNYMLLAKIVEKISGKPYEAYVHDEILVPVGATKTEIAGGSLAGRKTGEAKYYGQQGDASWVYDKMNFLRGAGAMGWMSTSTDLLRFVNAIDSSATRPDILNGPTLRTMATTLPSSGGFGCGWAIENGEWYWWGSLPGTWAFLYRNANGTCIAAMANSRIQPNPNNGLYTFIPLINYIASDPGIAWQDIDQF